MTRHARATSLSQAQWALRLTFWLVSACSLAPLAGCNGGAHAESEVAGSNESPAVLELSDRVIHLNNIKIAVASIPSQPRKLSMRGNLALDVNRLVHVHSRFPGQIVQLARIEDRDENAGPASPRVKRTLNFMDRVSEGQKLGEIWSKELGEKKSELVDALVQLRIDRRNLDHLQELLRKGATTEKAVREAERKVEVGQIAVAKAERTLRSWSVTEEDIREVHAEADRIHQGGERNQEQDEKWATVEIVSPIEGTIVEKNVVEGDLVSADADLFKVADLSVLTAWVRAYEEEIPLLYSMPRPIFWTLRLNANPQVGAITGTIDRIGDIIDPNEHMAFLVGQVKNPNGQLHAGQFVTATVDLPPEQDVLEIPMRALVEDGDESVVLLEVEPNRFMARRVSVVRRNADLVYVRSRLTPQEKEKGLQELHEGDRVVASGALELKAAILEQQSHQPDAKGQEEKHTEKLKAEK